MSDNSRSPSTNAVDRTWWLNDPVGVLHKFEWEFGLAFDAHADLSDLRIAGYYAMNAAITAWSVIDWVAADLTESKCWDRALGAIHVENKHDLQEYARADRNMAAIEQIAIAAKHRTLNNGYKPGYLVTDDVVSESVGNLATHTRFMHIRLPGAEFDMRIVLHEASKWLRQLLIHLGYFP